MIQTSLEVAKSTSISGSCLFAMIEGFSGWNSIELLRIYDFSAGTRGGRYPNRPPVRDTILHLGLGTVDEGDKVWCFSEDNLLLFHVRPCLSLIVQEWVRNADVCFRRLPSPMDELTSFCGHCESLHRDVSFMYCFDYLAQ